MLAISEKKYTNQGNKLVEGNIPADAQTLLDVGCGTGVLAHHLSAKGVIVDGITLSTEERLEALKSCRHVELFNLEQGLPAFPEKTYDVIVASHVIEHIFDARPLLRSARKVLKDEGKLIIAVPNLFFWKYRLALLRGRFDYEESGVMDWTHIRWYHRDSLRSLCIDCGFDVVKEDASGAFPLGPLRSALPGVLSALIDKMSAEWLPGLLAWQRLVILKKAKNEGGNHR